MSAMATDPVHAYGGGTGQRAGPSPAASFSAWSHAWSSCGGAGTSRTHHEDALAALAEMAAGIGHAADTCGDAMMDGGAGIGPHDVRSPSEGSNASDGDAPPLAKRSTSTDSMSDEPRAGKRLRRNRVWVDVGGERSGA